jgi:hypothetical protein
MRTVKKEESIPMSEQPQYQYETLSSGDINAATNAAQVVLERQTERVRPYLPELIKRLFYVYGLPITLIMLTSIFGGIVVSTFIPVSTTNVLIFGLNIFILVQVWRWAEKRWQATGLFVQYSRFSRAKRDLKDLIQSAQEGNIKEASVIDTQNSTVRLLADTFIKNALDAGVTAYEAK